MPQIDQNCFQINRKKKTLKCIGSLKFTNDQKRQKLIKNAKLLLNC